MLDYNLKNVRMSKVTDIQPDYIQQKMLVN